LKKRKYPKKIQGRNCFPEKLHCGDFPSGNNICRSASLRGKSEFPGVIASDHTGQLTTPFICFSTESSYAIFAC